MKTSDFFCIFVNIWLAALVLANGAFENGICAIFLVFNGWGMIHYSSKEFKEEEAKEDKPTTTP